MERGLGARRRSFGEGARQVEANMKRFIGAFLAAALTLPAVAWAGAKMASRCPLPCGSHCPFPCTDCPLKK